MNTMKHFIFTNDYEAWKLIENGPHKIKREMSDWDTNYLNLLQLNAQAMHILFSVLKDEKYKKVSHCEGAKEIWEKLEELCEERHEREFEEDDFLDESSASENEEFRQFRTSTLSYKAGSSSCEPLVATNSGLESIFEKLALESQDLSLK